MSNGLQDIMDVIGRNQSSDLLQGVIQSISGANALVRVNGSGRTQEAWYNKNSNLTPGDSCVLVRTNKNGRWVVMAGFSTNYGGHNDATPPPTDGTGVINVTGRPSDIYTSGQPSFNLSGASAVYSIVFRQQVQVYRSGIMLAGWVGYVFNTTTTDVTAKLLIDGEIIVCNENKADVTGAIGGQSKALPLIGVASGLSRGGHELQLHVKVLGGTGTLYQSSMFAVELF
jgi:hypothetical protein